MPFLQKVTPGGKQKVTTPDRPLVASVKRTLEVFARQATAPADEGVAKIEVHDTVSNVAWAYEKLRQAIDYQDEHLLRKNAIERILKRRLVAGATSEAIAEPLVLELIRGRYLPNNDLPVTVIVQVNAIINRYIHLWSHVPTVTDTKEADQLFQWYLGLVAIEINEVFTPPDHDEALVKLMYDTTSRDITFAEGHVKESDQDAQIYIAIHRALLKSDTEIIRYHLFRRLYPGWSEADATVIAEIGQHFVSIRQRVEDQLLHPAGDLLQRVMKKYAIIFLIFDDIARKHGSAAASEFVHPDTAVADIQTVYTQRRKTVTNKIARSLVRSFIYILLTKMFLVLILEIPINRFIFHSGIQLMPLLTSVSIPPLLLVLVGLTIRPPGKKNEDGVVAKVQDLLYRGDDRHALVKPRKPIRRSTAFMYFYRVIYFLLFVVVFGGFIALLTRLHFTPFDQLIFLLFLTLVSFFGIRVRNLSRELLVVDHRENIFTVLFDFITVPIVQVGRWISLRAPKINVLIFFLDVIIEAPFKAFLEATEGFFGFLREKREEIY